MIQVSQLTKLYGPRAAIHRLSFHVDKGEVVGFLGPNGAGKSTTMKILTGFMPAHEGTAKLCGYDVFEQPLEVKKNVGFLPENPPLYPEMIVKDYLGFAAQLHQIPSSQIRLAIQTVVEKVALKDVQNRIIGNLSKGYRQRVGLAQALIHNPPVLILDEPTVGLDPKQIIEIRQLIRSLQGDHTIILSSHILPEVTATSQRIIVINQGQIVAEDTIDRLTHRMQKGLSYHLMVQKASASQIEALRNLPGVRHLSVKENHLTLELETGKEDLRAQIVAKAVEQNMGVLEFAADKVSLEDVFLQLTTLEKTTGDAL